MPRPSILALLLLLGAAPPPKRPQRPARPQRIVSLNLCADQYLLALADRGQIAALTRLSLDPDMSAAASSARGLPTIRGGAEEVLTLRPDLVIAAPYRLTTLPDPRVPTLALDQANSYADIKAQIRAVAAAIGHRPRGEALIARMDRELAAIPRAGRGKVAAYYQRRGYLTGAGTLVDDLLQRVNLRNLAPLLHKPPLSRVGLEEMALARPNYLIIETAPNGLSDHGSELLIHPLLASIPRLRLPQSWTVCGGPAYVLAARSLAIQAGRTVVTGRVSDDDAARPTLRSRR